jgi:hypothetical protein
MLLLLLQLEEAALSSTRVHARNSVKLFYVLRVAAAAAAAAATAAAAA